MPRRLLGAVLLFFSFTFASVASQVKDVFPMQQGAHEFNIATGKIMVVVGTYQDTTTYHRSYNFYFVPKGDEVWNQVPLLRKPGELEFTSNSVGEGDRTIADGLAVKQGNRVYFVRAAKQSGKGAQFDRETVVTWYQFVEAPDSEPDEPAYALKPIFTRTYGGSKLDVDAILQKEFSLKPSK